MARYKVSNKNIYGLKSGDLQTFVICVPLIIVLALICAFWIAPLFYPLYAEKYTLDQGAVGRSPRRIRPWRLPLPTWNG